MELDGNDYGDAMFTLIEDDDAFSTYEPYNFDEICPNEDIQGLSLIPDIPAQHVRKLSTPSQYPIVGGIQPPIMSKMYLPFPLQLASDNPLSPCHLRRQSAPSKNPIIKVDDEEDFLNFCQQKKLKINPILYGLIPVKYWKNEDIPFGDLITNYFQRKNNANSRFVHKLYNALRLTTVKPELTAYLGVVWVSDRVFKVYESKFSRALGIRTINGSLFHKQGNFPSHGFVELTHQYARTMVPPIHLLDVDYQHVRLIAHARGIFTVFFNEKDFERCKWMTSN